MGSRASARRRTARGSRASARAVACSRRSTERTVAPATTASWRSTRPSSGTPGARTRWAGPRASRCRPGGPIGGRLRPGRGIRGVVPVRAGRSGRRLGPAAAAGGREPDRQRRHARPRRRGPGAAGPSGRRGGAGGARSRDRHPGRRSAPRVRVPPPRRERRRDRGIGDRVGPRHKDRCAARRHDRGGTRRRRGADVHGAAATTRELAVGRTRRGAMLDAAAPGS